MLGNQLLVELKRAFNLKNGSIWVCVLLIPVIRFFMMKDSYEFFTPVEVFQETLSGIIPLLFPAIIMVIYLPNFLEEQKNNFIQYTRTRIPLNIYLFSKGLVNAIATGLLTFLLVFGSFIFALFIEPSLGLISYAPIDEYTTIPKFTFSQLLSFGDFTYGLIYSLWVSINAVMYSTVAFILLLTLKNPFVALSVPFLYYHIFNFVTGVLAEPQFSPLSSIFPFNIIQQPLWTVLVPFLFLLITLIGSYLFAIRKQEEWVI